MSNIPEKIDDAIYTFQCAARNFERASEESKAPAKRELIDKRAALKAAIAEAIASGKAEPAPESSARELIDNLLNANSPPRYSEATMQEFRDARDRLRFYIENLEHDLADARAGRDMARNLQEQHAKDLAALDEQLATEREGRAIDNAGYAQAVKDRDELGRMYADACNAGARQAAQIEQLTEELEYARAEIATLNETLASCDSIKIAEELEAMRAQLANMQADLGIARGERDANKAALMKHINHLPAHLERIIVIRGWLDALANGYLTPEGITAGARKNMEALAEMHYALAGRAIK